LDCVTIADYGDPIGFVCPHAGYIYSGLTAAHSFKYLKDREYDKVIILSPSHFDDYNGIISLQYIPDPIFGVSLTDFAVDKIQKNPYFTALAGI